MARTNIRALRFAEAAFAVARDSNQLDAWLEALKQASSIFENHAAALFLTSPVEPSDKKRDVLNQLLPGVSPDVQRFLAILAHRERLDLVPEITVAFRLIFELLPDLEVIGEPDRLRSSFVNGIKRLPARLAG